MKAIVLKPIVWNTNNYLKPSGVIHSGGFARKNGYGHEEWNNNPSQIWRGFKVFHAEKTNRLLAYSKTGELGMIFIAAHDGAQYAVGIATSIYNNSKEEMKLISEELGFNSRWKDVWDIANVKKQFHYNKAKLQKHWKANCYWMLWKCPEDEYVSFDSPILLHPQKISGKSRLVSEHGRFQGIYPTQAIDIIKSSLSSDSPVIKWLKSSDFDESIIPNTLKAYRKGKKNIPNNYSGSNSPAQRRFSYWVEGNRTAEPLHARLQAKYVKFLIQENISPQENKNYVDITYNSNGATVFAEVKPTDNIDTKYAIRAGIGQILEYRHYLSKKANLEIVLGSKPKKEEIKFVASLGINLVYYDKARDTFTRCKKKA